MSKQKTWLASILCILAACTSHTLAPEIIPSPQSALPTEETPTIKATGPWTFITSAQIHRYRSQSITTINETSAFKSRADTIRLSTYFTIGLSPLPSATTIAGQIDSLVLSSNAKIPVNKSNIKLPIPFTGNLADNVLILRPSESQSDCVPPTSTILGEIRPVIFLHPSPLFSTSTWKDSLSIATCSSTQIPTTVKLASSYQVSGRTRYGIIPALAIQRTDSTYFVGHGMQNQHQVDMTGVGVSLTNIYLDINTGTIALTDTRAITSITIRISGQERRFTQEVTQRVDLIP